MADDGSGVVTGTSSTTYTIYDTSDGSVAFQKTDTTPTATYTGVGDPYAFLGPGEQVQTGDATGALNPASTMPFDIVTEIEKIGSKAASAVSSGTSSFANWVGNETSAVASTITTLLALAVIGLGLFYFGPYIKRKLG